MQNNLSLSITIPTLNRKELLEITLKLLIEQASQSLIPIEINVSDNSSDDDTPILFSNGGLFKDHVRYFRFEERVNIEDSFARAISISNGKFILLFGDDDIPLPGLVYEITRLILLHADSGFFYINRIIGDMNLVKTNEIPHFNSPFGYIQMPIGEFIRNFTHWPGFVSCLVFSRDAWDNGASEKNDFEGFNFLNRIYFGSSNKNVTYVASPLVIQRRGIQSWKSKWPQYWLISIPKLLENLEKKGVTTNAVKLWQRDEVTLKRFLIDCLVAKAYNYNYKSDFWNISRAYQYSLSKKIFSFIIQYFVPHLLAKYIYSKSNKMT